MEGIGYWIFLAVMYLLSMFFKKRNQQVPNDLVPSNNKKPNPFEAEFLQDMFGDLKEMVQKEEEKEEELADFEYIVEEEAPETINIPKEHDHVVFEDLSSPERKPIHEEYRFWKKKKEKSKGIGSLFTNMHDLKRAIVMKEVLDKPRALNRGIR